MQYAPQAQLNKFTNDLTMTGMSLANARDRTAMQLSSQEGIERNRLREGARVSNLNYLLSEGRLGMEMQGQQFGQQKDVATFNENKRAAGFREEMELMKFAKPDVDQKAADDKERLGTDAEWDIIDTELDSIVKGLDPIKDAGKIASMDSWRTKLSGWRKAPNSLAYLRAFQKSRTSNPMFGMINAQPAAKPSTGMGG